MRDRWLHDPILPAGRDLSDFAERLFIS